MSPPGWVLWLLLGWPAGLWAREPAPVAPPGWVPDSVMVPASLPLPGLRRLPAQRVRRLLGTRRLDAAGWALRLDSLAGWYADEGLPFASATPHGRASAGTLHLDSLVFDEGPRLVMGRLELDPPLAGVPDPARDLPAGAPLAGGRLKEGLEAWLGRLDGQGRALASLELDEIRLEPVEGKPLDEELSLWLRGHLVDADSVRPGALVVSDSGLTRQRTFERLIRLPAGSTWNPRRVEDARRRLLATGWFSSLDGPGLGRTRDGLVWWLKAEELPAYRFDGLLGWLPGRGSEAGRWTYHLDLVLANLAGTGREAHVLASRPAGTSQELLLEYHEPFLGRWPLDAGFSIRQKVQDSTWVELGAGLTAGWEPWSGWRLEAGASFHDLAPDSVNGYWLAGVDASRATQVGLVLRVDQRDDPRNPRRGWSAWVEETAISRNLKSMQGLPARGEDQELSRQRMGGWLWWPVAGRQVLALGASAGRFRGQAPGQEDLFRLGGQAGPRGWREESLLTRRYALGQLEWRWILGPASRAALFWDGLLWRASDGGNQRSHGRGAALVLPVRQGQLELQYALQPGQRWREGLLHVRVATRF